MTFARGVLWAVCWLAAAGLPAAASAESKPGGGGPGAVRLAVLNGSADDKASAESTVVLAELAKAFEAVDGLTVLDRDAIAKVLAEHRLSAMGVIRRPVEHGRMLGAAYLLYAQAPRLSSGRKLAMLCVEVSSGNVLWERGLDLDAVGDPEAVGPAIAALARQASAAIAANEARLDRPTATVLAVTNRSRSSRLDFLADSLNGTLEDLLAERGYRVLRRRNPGLLMKETTLGVSGMVRPDAAVLAEAAELVVAASFAEHPSADVTFQETPIRLTMELRPRGKGTRKMTFAFTLATLAKLAGDLRSALPAAGATGGAASAPADKEVSRRLEAARLMAELKDLDYGASLDEHRRQIELARRVIYLDPSAKEACYRLGISLDALTRRTWGHHDTHEGSSRDTADAMAAYLRFPRTDEEHVRWAFAYLATHLSVLNKDTPAKTIPIVKEFVRWRHKQDPTHRPKGGCWPDFYFEDWWARHPAARLGFYTWVDELYEKKGYESFYPVARAYACDQLGRADEAAEILYYGLVPKHIPQLELNSLKRAAPNRWWDRRRPEELAGRLGTKRSKALLAQLKRCHRSQPGPSGPVTYEQALGNRSRLWRYYLSADRDRLRKFKCKTVEGERVPVDRSVLLAVIIRRTPAGLWMQAGTGDGKLGLFHCADGKAWRAVSVPPALADVRIRGQLAQAHNRANSIVQVGDELLVATYDEGLFVQDLRARAWRHYGTAEGLPGKTISQMTLAADGKSALLAGEQFLFRYRRGQLFLSRLRTDRSIAGMVPWAGRLLMIFGFDSKERLVAVDPDAARATTLLSAAAARGLVPVPANVGLPCRNHYGVPARQRLAVLQGHAYYACQHGLIELGADGKVVKLWRPDGFFASGKLGGWVKGNCALPPCKLVEVLPDDRDADRLWLVSKWNDRTMYTFAYACFSKSFWPHLLGDRSGGACFITAFDTKTRRFSKPLRTKRPFALAQPFGDYVYLTGQVPSRLAKSLWVTDQPAPPDDAPLQIETPDTPAGRASRALLRGQEGNPASASH